VGIDDLRVRHRQRACAGQAAQVKGIWAGGIGITQELIT
jgi:hypothetical protein